MDQEGKGHGWRKRLARLKPRDRQELMLLVSALALLVLVFAVFKLGSEVLEGETRKFDEQILTALRDRANTADPVGPRWLRGAALDITALGSATVLGLVVLCVCGFLLLQGLYRHALFVLLASGGAWWLNSALKVAFGRARPDIVPHMREVMTLSFPSGHAMTSAAIYLTLGALLMRISDRGTTRFFCMAMAMLITFLVGASRVYLGVHYPTDVLAGWMAGLSWALVCWTIELALERRAGLKRERAEAR
jgi:undecaprenyl-diphosphatase